jgi:hypothetical protein
MDPGELLSFVAAALDRIGVPYFVTGSTATIAYGEPRFTNDIDIVIKIDESSVASFHRQFDNAAFYLAPETVRRAIRHASIFTLIHPSSGLKVDFVVAEDSPFNRSRFARARDLQIAEGRYVRFATPEDVILKKLEYYREGRSEKHLRDIVGVLRISGDQIDYEYLQRWVAALDLTNEWALVTKRDAD